MAEAKTSLVPKALAGVAAFLAVALPVAAPFLPTVGAVSLGTVATILAFICAALAGLGLPQVKFGSSKPLVPLTLVPVFAGAVPVVMQFAATTTGVVSVVLQGVALVLCFLAGLASPAPIKTVPEAAKLEAVKVLSK